ncbi:MAG: CBS domain-containing protein [Chloroflexota bacterium]
METILVEDVYKVHGTSSVSVPQEIALEEIITKFAREPGVTAVFLVDSRERFAGMISRADLLKWAQLRLPGRGGSREIHVGEVLRLVFATKAEDLARGDRRSLGVRPNDTLAKALEQMINQEEITIPVLDSEGKIMGDLRLSEVLHKALEVGRTGTE